MKDYGFMLRTDESIAPDAARVSAKVRDISEFISEISYLKYVIGLLWRSPIIRPARLRTDRR